jgi:hypothetical protein
VGAAAVEVVGVTGAEDAPLIFNGHFQPAGKDDTTLLSLMRQRNLACIGTGLIALL